MNGPCLRCADPACGKEHQRSQTDYSCSSCGGLLELAGPSAAGDADRWPAIWLDRRKSPEELDRSGVWRFRELLPALAPGQPVVTLGEGSTPLIPTGRGASWAGVDRLLVKQLGANPTGSFKDLGMTVCMTEACRQGAQVVACASTGNTSSSMAAYAARAGLRSVVLVPRGAVSGAKLAQAIDFGALVLEAGRNFDQAFSTLRGLAGELGLYLVNSINPFRIEGQKTVALEILEQLGWAPPDYLVLPGGNLGNCSAVGKGLLELKALGLLSRLPRLVVVQAEGASPFHKMWSERRQVLTAEDHPQTRATAIRIGSPANWTRAARVLSATDGLTAAVSDQEICAAKEQLASDGIGCEPASAATVAGIRQLRSKGAIAAGVEVVAVLTGHQLKDTDYILETRRPETGAGPAAAADPDSLRSALTTWLRAGRR